MGIRKIFENVKDLMASLAVENCDYAGVLAQQCQDVEVMDQNHLVLPKDQIPKAPDVRL